MKEALFKEILALGSTHFTRAHGEGTVLDGSKALLVVDLDIARVEAVADGDFVDAVHEEERLARVAG